MVQKNIELLTKDLSCRIPYGVIVNVSGISNVKLTSVSWYGEVGVDDGSTYLYPISEVKPYLFPLDSMTEEQKEEWKSLLMREAFGTSNNTFTPQDFYSKYHLDYRGLIPMGLAIDATNINVY